MIRVERVGKNGWDVHVEFENMRQEFALVAACVLKRMPLEEALEIVRKAADHSMEVTELTKSQSKIFFMRLYHLLELNNMTLKDLSDGGYMSFRDIEDIKHGTIPSIDCIRKLAAKFNVSEHYLFGVENGTNQRAD